MREASNAPAISKLEWLAVAAGCAVASLAAIAWSWQNHAMLNYGDAVAHLHIARRVFDSHRPGFTQLGSVWLPLPHLLMMPFVAVYGWWANGIAGTIPSALAYLAGCAGIYRLARNWLQPAPAALALAFFAANPNLLYLQTTAMTEPLFVCEMIWAAVWLVGWRRSLDANPARSSRLLWPIALVLVASVYTRYDGWIMTFAAWAAIGVTLMRRGQLKSRTFWLTSALVVAAPVAWFLYNAAAFGDWLYFARGPYSAKAIEMRTSVPGFPPHPGWHNPWVSLLFYMKAAELDAAVAARGNLMLALSLLGTAWAWITARRRAFRWALLLWFPAAFYAYSVAYGSVPIFLPVWWPHSYYNTRYGMELLPAFALGLGFAAQFVLAIVNEFKPREINPWWKRCVTGALFAVVAVNAAQMLHGLPRELLQIYLEGHAYVVEGPGERPLVYIEGTKNIESRLPYDEQIPPVLRELLKDRPGGEVLTITSVYPEIIASSGIPLRQTINESDKEFYQAALAAPASHAAVVLAFDDDDVARAVKAHPEGLTLVRRFAAPYQPTGAIYVSDFRTPH
jgi:hypothetical protein